jgi:hypothetical protein
MRPLPGAASVPPAVYRKHYPWESLCDDARDIRARCERIERITRTIEAIPAVHFQITDTAVEYAQELVSRCPWRGIDGTRRAAAVHDLAETCARLSADGFVHGDISPLNVVFDGRRLRLVDFEPSLRQVRFGKRVTMSSVPRLWTASARTGRPTTDSDRIGFYLTAVELMGGERPSARARAEGRDGWWDKVMPLPEPAFLALRYEELARLALRAYNAA